MNEFDGAVRWATMDPRDGPFADKVADALEEVVYRVDVPLRARWARALRWPAIYRRYRRVPGVSRREAWRLTHFAIWYKSQVVDRPPVGMRLGQ